MKKILIASPYLHSGGVEVALIRFLNELTKNKNLSVELLTLKKEGIYLERIPKKVKIIEVKYDDKIYTYENNIDYIKQIKGLKLKIKFLLYRLKLKLCIKFNNWELYYQYILKHAVIPNQKCDLAIDWHGYGHFVTSIVAEKIDARKKITWIHDEKIDWIDKVKKCINKFDKIYGVSKSCANAVVKHYPHLKNKVDTFYNLTDYKNVIAKSNDKINISFDKNKFNIVTIGRLEWQKGYDISVEVAKVLKENKINFCWYFIGGGSLYDELSVLIEKYNLENHIKLLGMIPNPYPYLKQADLYVQTSRHEGYGLAICEAKILGKPVVATNLNCIKEQIEDGKNGFLSNLNVEEFAEKIIKIFNNPKKIEKIKENLKNENFDYTYEFKKLYELMED